MGLRTARREELEIVMLVQAVLELVLVMGVEGEAAHG
jgi:hypothetical protein